MHASRCLWLLCFAGVALGLAACTSSSASSTTSSSSSTTTIAAPHPTTTSTTAVPVTTSPAASAASQLTGIGTTLARMEAIHGLDNGPGSTCATTGACFGAPVVNDESGRTYQFTSVSVVGGLITGYQQNFAPDTTVSAAESEIMQWMPKDATLGPLTIDENGGSCALFNITSPTLASLFNTALIGDGQGVLAVELSYTDPDLNVIYDPNDVQDAAIAATSSDPSSSC